MTKSAQRYALIGWIPVLLWGSLIYSLSSMNSTDPGFWTPEHTDKVVHAFLFGTLAMLIYPLARSVGLSPLAAACLAAVLSSLYGMADELRQAHIPGRYSTISDWIADTLGALSVFWLAQRERRSKGLP